MVMEKLLIKSLKAELTSIAGMCFCELLICYLLLSILKSFIDNSMTLVLCFPAFTNCRINISLNKT